MAKNKPYLKIISLKKVDSTSSYAFKLAKEGAAEVTVIKADIQTEGRGRFERSWASPKGGVYFSLVLRPEKTADEILLLPLAFSKAVARALQKYVDTKVKLPNDVRVKNKKIAGVLVETKAGRAKGVDFAVAGIGVNINSKKKELPAVATSLYAETGKSYNIDKLFKEILKEVLGSYQEFKK